MIRIKRLIKSFKYAYKGLRRVWREEQNFRIQVMTGAVIFILGAYFSISKTEWIFIIFAVFLVLLLELLNSAVERLADVLKPRMSAYVKEIKDIMAGAVFLSSLVALIIGLIVFFPYLKNL